MIRAECIKNALIMIKDHKLSLMSDLFIMDKFTHDHELPEGRNKQWDNCSKNRFGDSLPASKTCLAIISSRSLEK